MTKGRENTPADILAMIEPVTESGCWIWTGLLVHGYGRASYQSKKWKAHRLVWLILRGPFPGGGLEPDHLCRVRCCVNPDHLEWVPGLVNRLRGFASKGRPVGSGPFCVHGRTDWRLHNGTPTCRICRRARQKVLYRAGRTQPRPTRVYRHGPYCLHGDLSVYRTASGHYRCRLCHQARKRLARQKLKPST